MEPADTEPIAAPDDVRLVEALRAGDEVAFATLVRMYGRALHRFARMFVSSDAVAEDVVQEVWVAVLTGLDRFEGRSSLRTWIFRIAANIAKTRGVRESRSVPLSSFATADDDGPSVDPSRFTSAPDAGWWASPVRPWGLDAAQIALDAEAGQRIRAEIDRLPEAQRIVMTLRDVQGLGSDEVSAALGISLGNQRVILHRARSRVRAGLESYFASA
jgi:RNA polymerase sigma-70 factor (ECF subfamily)